MNALDVKLQRYKTVLCLRAVIAAGGNQGVAARTLGVHRNTLNRVLHKAGHNAPHLYRLAAEHRGKALGKKPVTSQDADIRERRVA